MKCWFSSPLLFLFAAAAFPSTELPISLEDEARAKITISCGFHNLPPSGYAPLAININNNSSYPQSWTFEFTSPGYVFLGTNSVKFSTSLTVPGNSARTFKVLAPLAVRDGYHAPLTVTVSGPGTSGKSRMLFPTSNRSAHPLTPFIAMGERQAGRSWSELEKQFDQNKEQLAGTRFLVEELPDDWRALAGITGIWLSAEEFTRLNAAQRDAVRDWVCGGGALFVGAGVNLGAQFYPTGFGQITPIAPGDLDIAATVRAIDSLKPTLETQLNNSYDESWAARKAIGTIKMNAPLLMGFMGLFAVVAGPINLFVFARQGRRHRLFWTTPAISLIASVLLFVIIVFQDGFGGSGIRMALIQVLPTTKRDVVLQEQVSRTGVLLSSAFTTREPVFLAPISMNRRPNAPKYKYENSDTRFGGDLFSSRSVQAQWIESLAPTRAEVTLLNPIELRDSGAAPVIVSSIGAPLHELYFRDEAGRLWHGSNVGTGQKTTLQSAHFIPDLLPAEAGSRLQVMWDRVRNQTGSFFATSSDPAAFIDTLPAIHWKDQHAVFVGPITLSAP